MVSSIDTAAVCGHLRAMLEGYLDDNLIEKVVGQLVNQSPTDYVCTATEIGAVFHNLMQGDLSINPASVPHLVRHHDTDKDRFPLGKVEPEDFKDRWIQILVQLPRTDDTLKLWASLTNLKSAAVIESLSRDEKKAQREVISHVCEPDPEVVEDFQQFVREYTPFLVKRLCINGEREYDILRSIPYSNKMSRTVSSNRLKPVNRGSAEFADLETALQHPVVYSMFVDYPEDSLAAVYLGVEVESVELHLPPKPAGLIPVGAAAVVPKDAQKPRIVWILIGALDSMARPMFHKLEEFESRWTLQGVMDQSKSRLIVQQALQRNLLKAVPEVFCSYDQSNFTDRFSYKYIQRPFVQALVDCQILRDYDLALLDRINYGYWDATALGLKHEFIQFGTGTGMGTPPSFPLASLSNGLMVAYCYYKETGKFLNPCTSRPIGQIVGDDCTIFNRAIGRRYEEFCTKIGLKINMDKSFVNSSIVEFCGKYITPTQILDKKKLKYTSSISNLIDQCEYYDDRIHQFYQAYPELELAGIHDVIEKLRLIPRPYGIGKTLDQIDIMSTEVELRTLAEATKALASRFDHRLSQRDVVESVERHFGVIKLRLATAVKLKPRPEPQRTEQGPIALAKSIALDALHTYDRMKSSSNWETFIQYATEIIEYYHNLTELLGHTKPNEFSAPTLSERKSRITDPVNELIDQVVLDGEHSDKNGMELDL
jgi:hypothetical protein